MEFQRKYQRPIGLEWVQNEFFTRAQKKTGKTPSPMREGKILSIYNKVDIPVDLGKNPTQFGGKHLQAIGKKHGSECTICIRFSQILSGRPRTPSPIPFARE